MKALPELPMNILDLNDESVQDWHTNTIAKLMMEELLPTVPQSLQSLYRYCLEKIEVEKFELRFIGEAYNFRVFQAIRELDRAKDENAQVSSNPGTNPLNHAVYSCDLGSLCLQEKRDRRYEISFHTSSRKVWAHRAKALELQQAAKV